VAACVSCRALDPGPQAGHYAPYSIDFYTIHDVSCGDPQTPTLCRGLGPRTTQTPLHSSAHTVTPALGIWVTKHLSTATMLGRHLIYWITEYHTIPLECKD
jgi:hypothetical protein